MKITAMTDTRDLRGRMEQWSRLVGKEMGEGLKQFARVACVDLANTTQPYSGKDSSGKSGNKSGQAKGEISVEVDISKVFYSPEPYGGFVNGLSEAAHESFSARAARSKRGFDPDAATLAFTNRVNGYAAAGNTAALRKLAKDFNWQGVIDQVDPALHQAARRPPRMKVEKADTRGKMYLVIGGRKTAIATYIKQVQKKVGLTKAGWAKCAELIPLNRVSSATRGIPAWVTRNIGRASGHIVDQSANKKNPKVQMTNSTPWASQCISPTQAVASLNLARNKFVEYMNQQIKYELRQQAKLKGA
jgi:hypothetical protein